MATEAYGYGAILTLNRCANVYGEAPCTANRPSGQECYNCFSTCQDKPNYVKVNDFLRLTDNLSHPPLNNTATAAARAQPALQAASATLDPNHTGPGIVLAGDLLSADFEVGKDFWESTRSTTAHATGKWWIEVWSDVDVNDFLNVMAGICVEGQELQGIPGFGDAESAKGHSLQQGDHAVGSRSWYFHNNIRNDIAPTGWNLASQVIMLLFDLDGGTFSYIVDGTTVVQIAAGILSDTWYACIAGGGPDAGLNINFGATAAINNPPAGYTPWGGGDGLTVWSPEGYPCLTKPPKITSAHIQRGQGLAVRGGASLTAIDFVHTDREPLSLDPYRETRYPPNFTQGNIPGTFWPRFKALYPYMQRSPVVIYYYTGADDGSVIIHSVRRYLFDTLNGPDSRGNVQIKCRDLLSQLDNDAAVTPFPDDAVLNTAINPTATTINIGGASLAWPSTNGDFTIQDEVITYAAFDGIQASGCTRGAYNTTSVAHDAGDRVQLVTVYGGVNIVDVLYDLLVNKGGVDPDTVPYNNDPLNPDEWDVEKEKYLQGHTINTGIAQPRKVASLVSSLLQQSYLHMWYEPTTAKIRLAATNTRVAEIEATPVSEDGDILAGTLVVKQRRKGIITQAWTYYDKYNYTLDDSPENYSSLQINADTALESENAWGRREVAVQFAYWLTGAGNIAITTNTRTLTENNSPRYELTFQVAADNPVSLGEFVVMRTDAVLDAEGLPQDLSCQIVKDVELIPTVNRELTASILRVVDPDGVLRFAHVVDVANESVEYTDATQPAKDAWGWISPVGGFNNGDPPYHIL